MIEKRSHQSFGFPGIPGILNRRDTPEILFLIKIYLYFPPEDKVLDPAAPPASRALSRPVFPPKDWVLTTLWDLRARVLFWLYPPSRNGTPSGPTPGTGVCSLLAWLTPWPFKSSTKSYSWMFRFLLQSSLVRLQERKHFWEGPCNCWSEPSCYLLCDVLMGW